jgi:hypothetical protein
MAGYILRDLQQLLVALFSSRFCSQLLFCLGPIRRFIPAAQTFSAFRNKICSALNLLDCHEPSILFYSRCGNILGG